MKLSEVQMEEVRNYIIAVPKYRKIYDELFDHVLNTSTERDAAFSIDEPAKIIKSDFGGFSEIVQQDAVLFLQHLCQGIYQV